MSISQPELDTLENQEFQRKSWLFQRWAWWLLGFFILAAALGMTGSGWLTRQRAEIPGGAADWPRFARQGATFEIDVTLRGGSSFWISHDYLNAFEVVGLIPKATREKGLPDRVEFITDVHPGATSKIRLLLKPIVAGFVGGQMGFNAEHDLRLGQLVYY